MRAKPAWTWAALPLAIVCAGPTRGWAQVASQPSGASRTVHRFDFEERSLGNLEDIPKYWERLDMVGFPPFATGSFDLDQGHHAPPSLYLASGGRNVALTYIGPDTKIKFSSDYRVEGFIRADELRYARACLSAQFLDQHSQPILSTMVRTEFVGGDDGHDGNNDGNHGGNDDDRADEWVRFELFLPAAPPNARTIGLTAWVLQASRWNTSTRTRRHIPRNDVHGGAWFDDIAVVSLPRVRLESSEADNVLSAEGVQELRATIAAQRGENLVGQLSIFAADGELVATHSIPTDAAAPTESTSVPVGHLRPGLYLARLDVSNEDTLILSRRLSFARLAEPIENARPGARAFGIVINPETRLEPAVEFSLLRRQMAKSAKLPVWSGIPSDPPTKAQRRANDWLVSELVKDGFALTAVLAGPPGPIVQGDGPYPRSLIDLLTEDETAWQEYLAAVAAPHAGAFRWWQVGRDDRVPTADAGKLTTALDRLRSAIRRFTTSPQLALPVSSFRGAPARTLPVEEIALSIGPELIPGWGARRFEELAGLGYDRLTAFVSPLPAAVYRGRERLADWVQRIALARHAGAATVFVPQTWRVRETVYGNISEPTEEYIVLRTLVDVVGDAAPGQRLDIAPTVECLAFHDGDRTTLVLWDATAPEGGRVYPIQMGQAVEVLDVWGQSTAMKRDQRGRQLVRLSAMPVFVRNVERWLVDLRASMTIEPAHVESGQELQRHIVQITHQGQFPVAGSIQFSPPKGWTVSPRSASFNLMPQRSVRLPIEVHYPHNASAGVKHIVARIDLPSSSYYMEVPLAVDVGLTDVDVWGMAYVEQASLVIRQVVTNRTSKTIHFRGTASVPGRQRQYRPLTNLRPGETQQVEYRFPGGQRLIGEEVTVGLREMNDGPRTHALTLVVP